MGSPFMTPLFAQILHLDTLSAHPLHLDTQIAYDKLLMLS